MIIEAQNDWISNCLQYKQVSLCCEAEGVVHPLLSSVLIHSFRLQSSLMAAQWCCLIQRDGDALFCWGHAQMECTVFCTDTISYHIRKLATTVRANRRVPAFSFWGIYFSHCVMSISSILLAEVSKNHHRSGCNNPLRLSRGLGGKGLWPWRKLACLCHLHHSHRISTWSVTFSIYRFFSVISYGTSDLGQSWQTSVEGGSCITRWHLVIYSPTSPVLRAAIMEGSVPVVW